MTLVHSSRTIYNNIPKWIAPASHHEYRHCDAQAARQAPDEMLALRKARRVVRGQSWLLALAFFFSFTPLSVQFSRSGTRWLAIEAPGIALALGAVGLVLWIVYAVVRYRNKVL